MGHNWKVPLMGFELLLWNYFLIVNNLEGENMVWATFNVQMSIVFLNFHFQMIVGALMSWYF